MRLSLLFCMLLFVFGSLDAASRYDVSLLTCSEGSDIYQLEGHTALRFKSGDSLDITVNWGVFDFHSPGFVYRFVKGETDYMAVAVPTRLFLNEYRREGRRVLEQVINLDSLQAERLAWMVNENLMPQNRVYRYNYVLDNCATRPLAMIESALGDTITLASPAVDRGERSTFRRAMRHYHSHYPWYQFGIDLALGSGIDREVSDRASTFAPVMLADMLAGATLPSGAPAVKASRWAVGGESTPSVILSPTPTLLSPLFWGWVVFALAFTVSVLQAKGIKKWARIFDTVWFTLMGLTGLLLTFLIFVSVHEATSPNWLYLWLNPLCFIGAVAPWLKSGKRLVFCYQIVNFALLIILVILFLLGVQSANVAFIPLLAATMLRSLCGIKYALK
ncbi:MAG: DUF4105 domain-containing protein [Muribaculaceae bacterium]|nr:DUF4105 domain-containing protein [Muribaculaceae bacterium]